VAVVNSHYFAGLFHPIRLTANLESGPPGAWILVQRRRRRRRLPVQRLHPRSGSPPSGRRRTPVRAMASPRRCAKPARDSHDTFSILFRVRRRPGHQNHRGKHLNNQTGFDVICQIQGQSGYAQTCYGGKALVKAAETATRAGGQSLRSRRGAEHRHVLPER